MLPRGPRACPLKWVGVDQSTDLLNDQRRSRRVVAVLGVEGELQLQFAVGQRPTGSTSIAEAGNLLGAAIREMHGHRRR